MKTAGIRLDFNHCELIGLHKVAFSDLTFAVYCGEDDSAYCTLLNI